MENGIHNNCVGLNPRLVNSKEKGTPGVELELKNEHGEVITHTLWITDKTMERVVKSLRHMGWVGDDISDLSSVGSQLCQIEVVTEDYNGRGYPKVAWINANESTGGGGVQPRMDPAQAKAFAARMRGQVIAVGGGKASAPAQRGSGGAPKSSQGALPPRPPAGYVPEQPAATGTDDDLGF